MHATTLLSDLMEMLLAKFYYVYILTNKNLTVLYTGVTSDLVQRVFQHKIKLNKGFTAKYNCDRLIYFEEFFDITEAIRREKQIKRYRRARKVNLINSQNPEWRDLSSEWYDPRELTSFIR